MDALPDELLLHIFAHINDGATLLHVVPHVCKRWASVARDPRAWRGITLRLPMDEEDHTIALEIISKAPAVGNLILVAPSTFWRNESRLVRRTLEDSWLVVLNELYIDRKPRFRRTTNALLSIVLRSRHYLKRLTMFFLARTHTEDYQTCFAVLRQAERLTMLRAYLGAKLDYNGELKDALPKLRHLELHETRPRADLPEGAFSDADALLVDMISHAQQFLGIFYSLPPSAVVLDAVATSPARELAAPPLFAPAFRRMPHLNSVHTWTRPTHVESVTKVFLDVCLPTVTRVHVLITCPFEEDRAEGRLYASEAMEIVRKRGLHLGSAVTYFVW